MGNGWISSRNATKWDLGSVRAKVMAMAADGVRQLMPETSNAKRYRLLVGDGLEGFVKDVIECGEDFRGGCPRKISQMAFAMLVLVQCNKDVERVDSGLGEFVFGA
jgi:hypothetical protein